MSDGASLGIFDSVGPLVGWLVLLFLDLFRLLDPQLNVDVIPPLPLPGDLVMPPGDFVLRDFRIMH